MELDRDEDDEAAWLLLVDQRKSLGAVEVEALTGELQEETLVNTSTAYDPWNHRQHRQHHVRSVPFGARLASCRVASHNPLQR
ncbi:hypothetical protein ACFX13_034880 [Malus domestica]